MDDLTEDHIQGVYQVRRWILLNLVWLVLLFLFLSPDLLQ